MSQTKKVVVGVLIILVAGYVGLLQRQQTPPVVVPDATPQSVGDDQITRAYRQRAKDLQVRGDGEVVRLLADDLDGSRHQRFILRLASGHTVLIAHNIDLAPRVDAIDVGDTIGFSGVYEWNERGGVVHWTHHDPQGRRQGGWIEHRGRRYR
ncbi:MAG: hypothetical protein B6D77_09015 [gamma proteobacterium symbiont of Ctena orbiculata]|uniref:DUF3465 domain-containing protein n=1 Tax=Candidatus Thiodiazotropha sp. CDECU1 TaxID=3065865 RepID=UPI000D56900E|nr:DUF3465 domain-containing protein [Candidatus Thiodiazotropha sp. CDECU1]PVV10041.1 MAG: hypothetical protein B6D77_09015 [gamma proteobacterium symbiont of Ctena orbiculata]PVV20368.1 MAG: hypothetical protein B6D78_10590 [gamma proteobacterium symbiont of Ctena orbiculata]